MNDQYWQQYYKQHSRKEPSEFARFCVSRIRRGSRIADLGAGDGRDSQLLKEAGQVLAIEPSADWGIESVALVNKGFLEYLRQAQNDPTSAFTPEVVYARWFFHAVEEETEDRVLDWCQANASTLMAEFRVVGGINPDDTHERRLIDATVFLHKLMDRGFRIEYYEESHGFSKVGDDDPYLGRVIAKR